MKKSNLSIAKAWISRKKTSFPRELRVYSNDNSIHFDYHPRDKDLPSLYLTVDLSSPLFLIDLNQYLGIIDAYWRTHGRNDSCALAA